jgi:hypothetical protein
VSGQHQAPAALPPGKTRHPLYRRLGGPQGRYGRVRKISPLPGFFFFLPYLFVSCSLCSIVHSRPIVLRAVDFSITKNPMASVGRIRSPDRPDCSQSLYRLCYPAQMTAYSTVLFPIPRSKTQYVIQGKINLEEEGKQITSQQKSKEIIPDGMTSLRITSTSPKRVRTAGTTLKPRRTSRCGVALLVMHR